MSYGMNVMHMNINYMSYNMNVMHMNINYMSYSMNDVIKDVVTLLY